VVTGLDAEGQSCVIVDGPGHPLSATSQMLWRSAVPADNSAMEDCEPAEFSFELMHAGSLFMRMEFQPGMREFWHATDSIDYIVLLEGEVTLMLEAGEVILRAGDFLVDRGVNHCWRNDGDQPAVAAIISLAALPVGKGRTV
jgi:quercetin dioxygenase-like cupin family protein